MEKLEIKNDVVQKIVLGGGCFWCLDPIFSTVHGVENVIVGYAGGNLKKPTYRQVCDGLTGHAEVLEISYNSDVINLEKLLEIFFSIHNPTTLNQQGADKGTQYRSIILYENHEQMITANKIFNDLDRSTAWSDPIVTQIVPLETFYPAEDYHQKYFEKNPSQSYCQLVIAPKIELFNKVFVK